MKSRLALIVFLMSLITSPVNAHPGPKGVAPGPAAYSAALMAAYAGLFYIHDFVRWVQGPGSAWGREAPVWMGTYDPGTGVYSPRRATPPLVATPSLGLQLSLGEAQRRAPLRPQPYAPSAMRRLPQLPGSAVAVAEEMFEGRVVLVQDAWMRALLVAISHGEIQPIPNHRGAEAPPGAMVMVPDSWRMGVRLSHAAMLEEFRRRLQDAQTGWRRGDSLDEYAIFTRTIASHEVYIVDLFFAIGTMLMEKYCFSFEDITIAETGSGLTVVIRKEILPKILNILGLKLMST